jgi:hypothetical protein
MGSIRSQTEPRPSAAAGRLAPRPCAWLLVWAAASGAGLSPAAPARAEDQRCKGTKQFYAGKCRYPDEITRLRDEEKKRREAAEAAKEQAEQQRLAEERARADEQACTEARTSGSRDGWSAYLQQHGDGGCAAEAAAAIATLDAASEPPPESPPAAPDPALAGESRTWEPSTLFWVGTAVTAAGAITWGVAGGILVGRSSDLEEQCPDGRCPAEREEDLQQAEVTAHVTTVGAVVTGVGAALTLVGAIWPLFEPEPEADDPAGETSRAPLRMGPFVKGPAIGWRVDY